MAVTMFVSPTGAPTQVSAANPLPVTGGGGGGSDTEFPAPTLTTDNFANPTTTDVKSFGMLWDGATWDRMPGNSTDGILVNLGTNNDVTITSGSVTMKAATSSAKGSVSIPTTAGGTALIAGNANRKYALIQNPSGVDIYVGTGTVTANDIKISPNGSLKWETQEAVKALSSSGTVTVNFIDLTN